MDKLFFSAKRNADKLRKRFSGAEDLVLNNFSMGCLTKRKCVLMYFDAMSDKIYLSESVVKPLSEIKPFGTKFNYSAQDIINKITVNQKAWERDTSKIIDALNCGDGVLFVDKSDKALILSVRATPKRNVTEPLSKTVIRGAHDGFTENFRDNTALLRSKIKSEDLTIRMLTMGDYTKTAVGVCYIKGLMDEKKANELYETVKNMKFKSVLESGYIQNELEKQRTSIFPLCEATERSDDAAIALLGGRAVIITENTPFVLIVPGLFKSMLTSSEDYTGNHFKRTVFISLRVIAMIVTLLLPAVYIAVVQYNPEFVSVKLISFIIYSRKYVPFPAFAEILFVELIFEAIIEAGIRLPKQIGTTVSIAGSIAIGQGLAEANLVNMSVVVIVAFTAVLVFVIPNYSLAVSVRILKFFFMSAAAAAGFFGIIMLCLMVAVNMCDAEFFGLEFLSGAVKGVKEPENVKKRASR